LYFEIDHGHSPPHRFPGEASLGYFLAWFQSLQLPSTQSESPLAPNCHLPFKVCTQL
jgi:hypothetical protein